MRRSMSVSCCNQTSEVFHVTKIDSCSSLLEPRGPEELLRDEKISTLTGVSLTAGERGSSAGVEDGETDVPVLDSVSTGGNPKALLVPELPVS